MTGVLSHLFGREYFNAANASLPFASDKKVDHASALAFLMLRKYVPLAAVKRIQFAADRSCRHSRNADFIILRCSFMSSFHQIFALGDGFSSGVELLMAS